MILSRFLVNFQFDNSLVLNQCPRSVFAWVHKAGGESLLLCSTHFRGEVVEGRLGRGSAAGQEAAGAESESVADFA